MSFEKNSSNEHQVIEEIIERCIYDEAISFNEVYLLLTTQDEESKSYIRKGALRKKIRIWSREITYSPNIFLPISKWCRNNCAYCAFRDLNSPPYLEKAFNVIIFNPPYLPSFSRETKNHDLVWNGGETGIEILIKFINQVMKFIESDQKFYIYYISSSLSSLDSLNQIFLEKGLENQVLSKKHISFETIYLNRLQAID